MLCWISILGGLLIMMGQHARAEALFYYFRLEIKFQRIIYRDLSCFRQLRRTKLYCL